MKRESIAERPIIPLQKAVWHKDSSFISNSETGIKDGENYQPTVKLERRRKWEAGSTTNSETGILTTGGWEALFATLSLSTHTGRHTGMYTTVIHTGRHTRAYNRVLHTQGGIPGHITVYIPTMGGMPG